MNTTLDTTITARRPLDFAADRLWRIHRRLAELYREVDDAADAADRSPLADALKAVLGSRYTAATQRLVRRVLLTATARRAYAEATRLQRAGERLRATGVFGARAPLGGVPWISDGEYLYRGGDVGPAWLAEEAAEVLNALSEAGRDDLCQDIVRQLVGAAVEARAA